MKKILSQSAFAVIVILAFSGALTTAASKQSASSILEPASGALLGQYYGAGTIEALGGLRPRLPETPQSSIIRSPCGPAFPENRENNREIWTGIAAATR